MAANNCTIEFSHGGTVHLQEDLDAVEHWLESALHAGTFLRLKRMKSFESRRAHDFPDILVNPNHVAAVYPLDTRSEPARSEMTVVTT